MGYTPVAHNALYGVIGVSLEQGFMNLYGMKEDEIEYAMNQYSKLYSIKGEEMILLYDGIAEAAAAACSAIIKNKSTEAVKLIPYTIYAG